MDFGLYHPFYQLLRRFSGFPVDPLAGKVASPLYVVVRVFGVSPEGDG
ncbi:MAG: hypothetical protein QN209_10250 [Armatimonadota bacterium]|nr:hypothetical protein [Armatimonadota bacterium]